MKKWIIGFFLPTALIGVMIISIGMVMISSLTVASSQAQASDCSTVQNAAPETPGTAQTDQVEKQVFEYLTQKEGFSGAGGAGALAVAKRESDFDPKATYPSGGVAGIFQWSGWAGNTINGTRISGGGFINPNDISTLTLDNQFKLINYELNGPYAKVKTTVGMDTDPEQAAMDWSLGYEGVDLSDPQTKPEQIKADAAIFYTKYNGASIPSSIKDTVEGGANETVDQSDDEANSGCEVGSGSGEQVNGKIPMGTYYDQLTPDQKKAIGKRPNFSSYPDDPTSAPYGHQCAWYVTYRAKEMGFNESTTAEGNGAVWGQSDPNFTSEVGKPVPHSAVDFKMGQAGRGSSEAGHTAFVEYVNPDGSLIISECNVVAGHHGMDRSTATQPEESYATISAEDAKTLTYVYPKDRQ